MRSERRNYISTISSPVLRAGLSPRILQHNRLLSCRIPATPRQPPRCPSCPPPGKDRVGFVFPTRFPRPSVARQTPADPLACSQVRGRSCQASRGRCAAPCRSRSRWRSDLQRAAQPGVLGGEPGYIAVAQHTLLQPGQLATDQFRNIREPEDFVQRYQVRLHHARSHQVDAGK